jgi:predicted alpha/beta-hydrolase family hydrolase
MKEQERKVEGVTVIDALPDSASAGWQLIYAPGAGSSVRDPFGAYLCERLAGVGIPATRFQFPYQEAGSRGPDRPPVLEASWLAVIDATRREGEKLIVSGRSMGGRVASLVASGGAAGVDGLVCFAYPLHQPGHPERARTAHLGTISVPTLFCSGTRDAFGAPDELGAAAALVPGSRLHLIDGADHGFGVLKRSGRTRENVWAEAADALLGWARERFDA